MKTMIVPLDGSALAEQALPYVHLLAPALGARVQLVQVVAAAERERRHAPAPAAWAGAGAGATWPLWPGGKPQREYPAHYLETHAAQLRAAGLDVAFELHCGDPACAIVEETMQQHAALIVMATHCYTGIKRWTLGSVADRVMHAALAPVLLVRSTARPAARKLKRILVPLDGSDVARQALPIALDLALGAQAELVVVQSVAPSIEEYIGAAPATVDLRAMLRDQVALAYAVRSGQGCPECAPVTPTVTVGRAAEVIVEEAERRRADLIVMATHGYSGARRWISGSVADSVLHHTTIPLLLVRARANAG